MNCSRSASLITCAPTSRSTRPANRRTKSQTRWQQLLKKSMATKKAAKSKSGMSLVVVESPAKAKTISKYLGSAYRVRASVGHIRDLPERELGVDVENGFEPKYVTIRGKGKIIQDLRKDADTVGEVILATDPDREGEAIAYHVAEQLGYEESKKAKTRFKRVLFHEITRDAVKRALEHPIELDMKKVE